ncbi:carcinoembryonic antigen-related cell adhesion molecule 18 isoform X1 [Neofelis nebulosa]|uniref:carcinoembryonic antigen-related cell adhesion molecule 18 isoform X1 n=1 Tax=Neofelis nebulosa TaxID=61452 RepID=UPI00272DAEFB|nr:carcinoembryonic antigen-related cell adhesion molecule 18 isoform X1 [Neofelis nebulosa]
MDLSRPRCRHWRELVLLASLLACGTRQAYSQISIDPESLLGIKGFRTILVLQNVTQDVQEYSWHRGANDTAENMIVSYKPPSETWQSGPMFSGRENVTRTGSLVIRRSALNDTGNYTARVDFGNRTEKATGCLSIQELENKPDIWANASSVVEYMDPVAAICYTNATNVNWYVEYTQVSSNDRMTISPDLKTLIIHRVSRYDKTLQCETESIPEFPWRSKPLSLSVDYGPDNVQLRTSHSILNGILSAEIGSQVHMECNAISRPSPKYHWTHNGSLLSLSGAKIILPSLAWEQMGRYRCIVENPMTQLAMYREFQIQVHRSDHSHVVNRGFYISGAKVVWLIVITVLSSVYLCGILIYMLISHLSTRRQRGT